ncbi:hypothetical protein [Leptospira noguchii]|uniref:hypothetical protein n=1 Tax=Leptospira noguchii TaxID=28182 RepID=UPI003D715637
MPGRSLLSGLWIAAKKSLLVFCSALNPLPPCSFLNFKAFDSVFKDSLSALVDFTSCSNFTAL